MSNTNHREVEETVAVTPARKASATHVFSRAAAVASSLHRATSKVEKDSTTISSQPPPPNPSSSRNLTPSHTSNSTSRAKKKDKKDAKYKLKKPDSDDSKKYLKGEVIDTSVMHYDSTIMVQSMLISSTITVNTKNDSTKQAQLSGSGISQARECLRLIPIHNDDPLRNYKSPTNSTKDVSDIQVLPTSTSSSVVRYGHTVALQSTSNQRALGVRGTDTIEIGFYRTILGQAEQWTILPPYETVMLGTTVFRPGRMVRSGHPLLLKNMLSGGLLSLHESEDDRLSIITRTNEKVRGHHPDEFSNEIQPCEREEFAFISIHVPPCPKWSRPSTLRGSRPYLDGSFLLHKRRNDEDLLGDVFSSSRRRNKDVKTRKLHKRLINDKGPLGHQEKRIQEGILLEEILGCLMGLEGHHIGIIHANDKADEDDEDGEDYGNQTAWNQDLIVNIGLFGCEDVDVNLLHVIQKIIPTCSAYIEVNAFVSNCLSGYESGRVCHALCGALDILLKEYLDFVVGLEDRYRSSNNEMDESSTTLTMNALWAEIQAPTRIMSILQHIIRVVKPYKGGALLNELDDLMTMQYLGDDKAAQMIRYLLEQSSIPYIDMLQFWLNTGFLKDPYGEFMIQQTTSTEKIRKGTQSNFRSFGEDWSNWYVIREEHVLNILKSQTRSKQGMAKSQINLKGNGDSLPEMILTTGKYWNAIQLCQQRNKKVVALPSPPHNKYNHEKLSFATSIVEMTRCIKNQNKASSRTFLNIVMRDYRMLDILSFMKRYFLLDQGDFFVHFLDMSEDELLQEIPDVSRSRVQNWMTMSIQMSGSDDDESLCFGLDKNITSSLKIDFATQSLVNHLDALHATSGGIQGDELKTPSRTMYGGSSSGLTGVAAFMLDFHQIPFPLSLILSRHTVTNYQLLFRHLFFAKHVERRLVGTWFDHQVIKEYQSLRKDLGRTYGLRHRMLHFMQQLIYYIQHEVIEPNWLRMKSRILERDGDVTQGEKYDWTFQRKRQGHTRTVDDILIIHNDFVRRTLKECLLTNRDLIRILTKLMTTCLLFSDQMKLFMETTQINQQQDQIATEQRQRRRRKMYEVMEGPDSKKKKVREAIEAEKEERRRRKQKQIDRLNHELNTESYKRMISRFEQVFNLNLSEFMSQLMSDSDGRYHTHLANLCTRLDFNGYLTSSIKE